MNNIYCSNCGKDIPASSNFCKFCGAAQHGADAAIYRAQAPVALTPADAQAVAANLKKVELFPRQHLGTDAIVYFFFSYIAKTIIILILCIIGLIFLPKIFIFGMSLYLIAIFLGALFTYNNFMFEINENGLTIDNGVINKSSVSLGFDEVQNVNIERTLMNRFLGIAVVIVETAGNSSAMGGETNGTRSGVAHIKAEAFLPGLRLEKAKKIHDLLIDGSDGMLGDD